MSHKATFLSDTKMEDESGDKFDHLNNVSNLLRNYLNVLSEKQGQSDDRERRSLMDDGSVVIETVELGIHDCASFGQDSYSSIMKFIGKCIQLESRKFDEVSQNILANLQIIVTRLGAIVNKENNDDYEKAEAVGDSTNNENIVNGKKYIKKELVRSLIKLEGTYKCQQCPQLTFEHFKTYQRHVKKTHQQTVTKTIKDHYICLLPKKGAPQKQCGQQIDKDGIVRHLTGVHKETKPPKKEFKGFITIDQKKTFSTCWGKKHEVIQEIEMIEIDENDNGSGSNSSNKAPQNLVQTVITDYLRAENNVGPEDNNFVNDTNGDEENVGDTNVEDKDNVGDTAFEDKDNVENNYVDNKETFLVGDNAELLVVTNDNDKIEEIREPLETVNEALIEDVVSESDPFLSDALVNVDPTEITIDDKMITDTVDNIVLESVPIEGCEYVIYDEVYKTPTKIFVNNKLLEVKYVSDGMFWIVNDKDQKVERKLAREENRKTIEAAIELYKLPENNNFVNNLEAWLIGNGSREERSTVTLTKNHLWKDRDSFLNYCYSVNPDFSFDKLICFTNENFISVPSPMGWIKKIGGQDGKHFPSRQAECLKAHKRLRDYLEFVIHETNFKGSEIVQKRAIQDHIQDIHSQTLKSGINTKLSKLYNFENKEKKQMTNLINPVDDEMIYNCVKNWFASDESDNLEREYQELYKKLMNCDKKDISKSDFNKFGGFCLFYLTLCDKSRCSVYDFKNKDYTMKVKVWIPPEATDPEFENIPDNWCLYSPPTPGAPPSRYEIRLSGNQAGVKGQQRQTISLNLKCHDLLEKYR